MANHCVFGYAQHFWVEQSGCLADQSCLLCWACKLAVTAVACNRLADGHMKGHKVDSLVAKPHSAQCS
jgi:hypothetical protein